MFSAKRLRLSAVYGGVNYAPDLYAHAAALATRPDTPPVSGGPLVINGQSVGDFDYTIKSTTNVSTWVHDEWFTPTEDTASAWAIVKGDLTIGSGILFRPDVRKLLTVVYVTGNLTLTGNMAMSGRGANHSGFGTGGRYIPPVPIRVYTGTLDGNANVTIPAAGGAGGISPGSGPHNGVAGGSAAWGTGGGGTGGSALLGSTMQGTAGTCFAGGSGSAGYGSSFTSASAPVANGGAGGTTANSSTTPSQMGLGGLGSPNGSPQFGSVSNFAAGGVLVVIVEGTVSGAGLLRSNGGTQSAAGYGANGGGSGAGVVLLLRRSGSATLEAIGGLCNGATHIGGSGGSGATATLTLPATSTWTGGDLTWTSPDTDSFNATYINGNAAVFNISASTTVTLSGTIAPARTTANVTAGALTFAGAALGGAGALIKNGEGSLVLSAANTYSGGTVINAGALATPTDANLGASGTPVTLNVSQTWVPGNTYARPFVLNNGAILTFFGIGSATISGAVTGDGGVQASRSGAGGVYVSLTSTANTFTGPLILNTARTMTFTVNSLRDVPGAGNIIIRGATNEAGDFIWGAGAITGLVLNYRQIEIGDQSTNISGILNNNANAANAITINTDLLITGGGATRTLRLGGSNTGTNTFAGQISDGVGAVISVIKADAGTWLLSGANTYTGSTSIVSVGGLISSPESYLRVTGAGVLGGAAGSQTAEGNINFTGSGTNGVLEFSTAAQLGPASQIRWSSTSSAVGYGGKLKFVGTTAQFISKTLFCDGVSIRLDASGSAGVVFNGPFVQTNKNLILNGTGSGAIESSFTGTGICFKTDSGFWSIRALPAWTGQTTVQSGTLELTVLVSGDTSKFAFAQFQPSSNRVVVWFKSGQTPVAGEQYRLLSGSTAGTWPVTLFSEPSSTPIAGRTGTYNAATSTVTIA